MCSVGAQCFIIHIYISQKQGGGTERQLIGTQNKKVKETNADEESLRKLDTCSLKEVIIIHAFSYEMQR